MDQNERMDLVFKIAARARHAIEFAAAGLPADEKWRVSVLAAAIVLNELNVNAARDVPELPDGLVDTVNNMAKSAAWLARTATSVQAKSPVS